MRKWIGALCVILGILCLLGAIGLVVRNRLEAENAAAASKFLLKEVQQAVAAEKTEEPTTDEAGDREVTEDRELPEEEIAPTEMATIPVEGYDCIGVLSIPVLALELPVLTDWSYEKLNKAPCLYYGSYYEPDFVIAAHNYWAHFGRLPELQAGDLVVFTDVNGVAHYYEVILLETLPMEATLEMITSGFDLSLYTCTTAGSNRITVRCNTIETGK